MNSPDPRPIGRYNGSGAFQRELVPDDPEDAERFELCLLLFPALLATLSVEGAAEVFPANGLVTGFVGASVEECGATGFATATGPLGFLDGASDGPCFLIGCVNAGWVLEGILIFYCEIRKCHLPCSLEAQIIGLGFKKIRLTYEWMLKWNAVA